jgi:hypothetical protein
MKLSWIRSSGELSSDAVQTPGDAATQMAIERALTVIRSANSERTNQASNGLELRVLAALETQSEGRRRAGGWQTMHAVCSRGWVPATVAAALLCVFTGGVFVEQETSRALRTHQEVLAGPTTRPGAVSLPGLALMPVAGGRRDGATGTKELATASARRKPATPISTGRRRGRATEVRVPESR